ncbi:hypothetical protein GGU10DRAFT_28373 [Lentinula aff. detonsa]|uniref:Uncharacterized protein n=1 Tax=Lentinula aff. detonsa TaxID=2804958 RepID=A0AA38KNR0_9AGAR|nr:hypothetical protein GGU10DRAFT_28373 [Lentinula aff. detonsa]
MLYFFLAVSRIRFPRLHLWSSYTKDNATIIVYTDWFLTCPAENIIAAASKSTALPLWQRAHGLSFYDPFGLCTFPILSRTTGVILVIHTRSSERTTSSLNPCAYQLTFRTRISSKISGLLSFERELKIQTSQLKDLRIKACSGCSRTRSGSGLIR